MVVVEQTVMELLPVEPYCCVDFEVECDYGYNSPVEETYYMEVGTDTAVDTVAGMTVDTGKGVMVVLPLVEVLLVKSLGVG